MIRGTVDSRHENLEDTIDCREVVRLTASSTGNFYLIYVSP